MFHMYEKIWEFYKKNQLHNLQHKRSARYTILLDFIREMLDKRKPKYEAAADIVVKTDGKDVKTICENLKKVSNIKTIARIG